MEKKRDSKTKEQLILENDDLRARLSVVENVLQAVRTGQVDALVGTGDYEDRLFTRQGAQHAYQVLVEEMNEGAVMLNSDGLVVYCNRRFARMLRIPLEKIMGTSIYNWIVQPDHDVFKNLLQLSKMQGVHDEIALQRHDGTLLPAYVSMNEPGTGEIPFCLVVTDLTEQKNRENELKEINKALEAEITTRKYVEDDLRKSEARFRQMFERHDAIMLLIDPNSGIIVDVNIAAQHFYGYSADELKGMNIQDINALPHEEVATQRAKALNENINYFVFPHRLANGDIRMVEVHSSPVSIQEKTFLFSVIHDITDRQKAEEAIHFHASLLNRVAQAIIVTDMEGKINYWNSFAETLYGWKAEEAVGQNIGMLVNSEGKSQLFAEVWALFSQGKTWSGEYEMQHKDGHFIPAWNTNTPLTDPQGRLVGVIGISFDISERRRSEEQMQNALNDLAIERSLLRQLIDNIPDLIFLKDPESRFMVANKATASFMGASSPEQLIGRTDHDFYQKPDADRYRATEQQIMQSGEGLFGREHLQLDVHQNPHWLASTKLPLHNTQGQMVGMVGIERDITGRKMAEESLRESEERLRSIYETSPDAIALFDTLGSIIMMNAAALKIYGYNSSSEMVGKNVLRFFLPEEQEHVRQMIGQVLTTGTIRDAQATLLRKDGTMVNIEFSASAVYDPSGGKPTGFMALSRDITERKRMEKQLLESEAKFASVFQFVPLSLILVDDAGRIVSVNNSACQALGLSGDEIMGKPMSEFGSVSGANRQRMRDALLNKTDTVNSIELQLQTRDKQLRDFIFSTSPIVLDGLPHHLIAALDITERKRTEQSLRISEEKYRGLIENLDTAVAIVDDNGKFLYMNSIMAHRTGGIPSDFVGKTLSDIFPEHISSRQLALARKIILEDQKQVIEEELLLQGELRWHRTSVLPLHYEQGKATSVMIISTDIHELKRTQLELLELNRTLEERVKERTAQVQDLYDNAPVGYHSLDADGCLVAINKTTLDWTGYTRSELIGKHVSVILTPKSVETFNENFNDFKISGILRDTGLEIKRKDGTTFFVMANSVAVYDTGGNYHYSRSTLTDITKRKQAEDALRESEARMNLAFQAAQDGIWDWNMETDEVFYSSRWKSMLGYDENEVEHHVNAWKRLLHPDDMEHALQVVSDVMHERREYVMEFRMRHKDGHYVDILSRGFPIRRSSNGKIVRIVGTHLDLTERKRNEETLRNINEELERAMRLKDEFLANMSHELRTPLNAILGLSEILIRQMAGTLNEKQLRSLKTIENSGRHLLELITDILDLSKIQADKLTLEPSFINVTDVCEASLIFVREAAMKKNISLTITTDPEVVMVWADGRRLKQMLINLLTNSVKFTPDNGKIELQVTSNKAEQTVSFSVTDTGIGISPKNIEKLFKPFVQVEGGLNRQYEGTGLGLALVQRMAQLHGGSLSVQSELGKGSRFTIILPYTDEAPKLPSALTAPGIIEKITAVADAAGNAPLILVAEDNQANINVISAFLEYAECRYAIALNGKEALEKVQHERPDLILMDIQMPDMDGIEAIHRLRSNPDPEIAKIPVIALTALAMLGDRERFIEAGADDYLSKPVDLSKLAELIKKFVARE